MSTPHQKFLLSWIERSLLFLAVLYLGVHTLPHAWKTLNTDFPNYYTAARLVHEGYDTSRMYEWPWIEREKDHRAVDIRVIGLLPITPFSTLVMLPLAGLVPLAAKHVWIILNLLFLAPIGWFLRSMTGLSYQRIALAIFLSFPLHRNLLFGQFYVLLLLLLLAGCWSYLKGFRVLAGSLVGIAAVCKIFPLLLFVFFLRRRDWRALTSGTLTSLAAIGISVFTFGMRVHLTWLQMILSWVLHGEGMPPYVPSASISGLLHIFLLSEPQWNPHPLYYSPLSYAVLAPSLQMLAIAPAILLIQRNDKPDRGALLEWSALITAALVTSTIPASYNFVLMVFPVCVVAMTLLRVRCYGWVIALLVAYLGIGYPVSIPNGTSGLALLSYTPRLPLMMALLLGIYVLMWQKRIKDKPFFDRSRWLWATAMALSVFFGILSTLHLERAEREEYAYRLPLNSQGFLNAAPQALGNGVQYAAFTFAGYQLVTPEEGAISSDAYDVLSFSRGFGHLFVERASSPQSQIIDLQSPSRIVINDAREPMLSADGRGLAFVRDDHGRGRLMLRNEYQSDHATESTLTPERLNVYEASFSSEHEYAFSAAREGGAPMIYITDAAHRNSPVGLEDARYPALSPDGRWMAYSQLQHGFWNLWIRDQISGVIRRIADVPCNQIEPAWETDSRTLLYGVDCGRSVWFTAVARRRVIP